MRDTLFVLLKFLLFFGGGTRCKEKQILLVSNPTYKAVTHVSCAATLHLQLILWKVQSSILGEFSALLHFPFWLRKPK